MLSELCLLRLITQAAERRLPVIGACYCFMGVDEKVGGADEREDGRGSIHLSDTLVTGSSEIGGEGVRGRGGGVKE